MGRYFRAGLVALILALTFGNLNCSLTLTRRKADYYDSRLGTICFMQTCDDPKQDAEMQVREYLESRAPKDKYGHAIIDQSELKSYIVGSSRTLKRHGNAYIIEIVKDKQETVK